MTFKLYECCLIKELTEDEKIYRIVQYEKTTVNFLYEEALKKCFCSFDNKFYFKKSIDNVPWA